jgi:hypothetical protein
MAVFLDVKMIQRECVFSDQWENTTKIQDIKPKKKISLADLIA